MLYLICFNCSVGYLDAICEFVVTGTRIECYCYTNHKGYVLVVIEFVTAWVLLAVILLYFTQWNDRPCDPEMQVNMVLCNPDQAVYEYLVVFRVGLATKGFDYNTNYIDLQLLTTNDEPIGQPNRYSCAKLPDKMCTEMHMLVGLISAIPPITGVQANHADSHNLLHFQDFMVLNLRGEYTVVQAENIDQFITSEPFIFRPQPKVSAAKSKVQDNLSKTKPAWLPLASSETHASEKVAICVFALGFIAIGTMFARIELHCYQYWKDMVRSMLHFSLCLVTVSISVWLLIFLIKFIYATCIEQNYMYESYMKATRNDGSSCYRIIRILYLLVLNIIGIVLSGYTISLSYQYKLDYTSAFIWSGINSCTAVMAIGLWLVLDEWIYESIKSIYAEKDFVQQMYNHNKSPAISHQVYSNQSTIFKLLSTKSVKSTTSSTAGIINSGPKLMNPEMYLKNKASQCCKETNSTQKLPKNESTIISVKAAKSQMLHPSKAKQLPT